MEREEREMWQKKGRVKEKGEREMEGREEEG
jgi:hypothetical protein